MSTSQDKMNNVVIVGCIAILLLCGLGQFMLYQEIHTGVFRCVKTYTVTTGSGKYIETSKRVDLKPESGATETMRCDDALTLGQFNSGNLYANFEAGKWYRITARGPRNNLMSMFPNITEAVEIEHK